MPNFKTPEQVKALCERLLKRPRIDWKHDRPVMRGESKLSTDLTLLLLSYEQMYYAYDAIAREWETVSDAKQ